MDIRQYLTGKGFTWKEKTGTNGIELIFNCPFCGDKENKFAMNLENGAFNCMHKNTCGAQGSFWDFQKRMGDNPRHLDNNKWIAPIKKNEYKPIQVTTKKLSDEILNYLTKERNFKIEIIKQFRLGQNENGTAIMYPFFKSGKVVNVKYRSIVEKKFWNENGGEPVLFNRDVSTGNDSLYITEGQDDCIALKHYGIDSVSVPSGTGDMRWIEHEWDYLETFKNIYLIFDNDQAGQIAVEQVVNRLGKWRCYKILLPEKDVNDCLKKNVSIDELGKCIVNAKEYTHEHVRSAASFLSQLVNHVSDIKTLNGISTGFIGIDKILKGWREGEFSVWTGNSGSGKSTFINQVILNLTEQNEKAITASLEIGAKNYLRWAIMQHCRKSTIDEHDIKGSLSMFGNKWFIFNIAGETSEDVLLDAFIFGARKYGIKHFFIDSLMRVQLKDRDEYKGQKEFCTRLVNFAQEYKAHVHLVAHPRKGNTDRETPDKVDISGTAHITNMAHNVFVMARMGDGENFDADNYFYIKKNREFGFEGNIGLKFDNESKIFSEIGVSYKAKRKKNEKNYTDTN